MRFFAKIHNNHWVPKNQLQKEFQHYCTGIDRLILESANQVEQYKYEVGKKVAQLNNKYVRCKPLEYKAWKRGLAVDNNVEFVGVLEVCIIGIWQEQEVQP